MQTIENKLSPARLEYKLKQKSFRLTEENQKSGDVENDHNNIERFDTIRHRCDQFAWNVLSNDSHLFIFTTYKIWNQSVCSLSDIQRNSTYAYVCQYGS